MLRLYAKAAAVALLVCGVAGFSKLWGLDPLTGLFHAGLGALFVYAGFFQRDSATVRQVVGGLGVLLLVVGSAAVLATLVASGRFARDPFEVTCLVLGVGSILAAKYLPDEPRSSDGRRNRRKT